MFHYVATPYTRYPGGIEAAFEAACRETALLVSCGVSAFSPIAHTHPIAKAGKIDPLDHAFWMRADEPMMEAAGGLIVVKLPGWESSKGVGMEIRHFIARHKPVIYMTPGIVPARLFGAGYDEGSYDAALRSGAE